MKILIIDDEKKLRRILSDFLRKNGFETVEGNGGLDGIEMAIQHKDIALILLDIRMPKMDGYETIVELKKVTDAPVIFLTALNESYDEIKGLELGADDYISKPFKFEILLARINVCLRNNIEMRDMVVVYENMKIDLKNRQVYIEKAPINLTQMEYELLLYLFRNKGINLQRTLILDRVWGYDYYGDPRTVDTHIKTLRSKMGHYSKLLKTVRGVGYNLEL
jgi:DNA-binding response OmpR family regulator